MRLFACRQFKQLVKKSLPKTLLIMKLTTVLLLATSLSVGAKGFSQKVSLAEKNATLEKVFKKINRQTGYTFVFTESLLQKSKGINISVKNLSIEEVLEICFNDQPLTYTILNKMVVVKERDVLLEKETLPTPTPAPDAIIIGKVLDEKGLPLSGATVTLKSNKKVATTTDASGNFSIDAPGESAVVIISYVGYNTMEIEAKSGQSVAISLIVAEKDIEEVVIVGYGSQRKKDVTGAVSSVKARDLNVVNAVSIDNLLQGKAAGVVISQRSAQPGGGLDITIRGALSPRGGSEPLYVIDGVPLTTAGANNSGKLGPSGPAGNAFIDGVDRSPLASLNPNDIESIDILKDASAAAIYGSAAANGVILITTKRGRSGKPVVSISSSYANQSVSRQVEPLNAKDFMTLSNTALKEQWLFTNRYAPYGLTTAPASGWGVNYSDAELNATTPIYNHVKEIFRKGIIADNNLSISGGNESTKYFIGFNNLDQKSLLKTTDFNRMSGRINIDQTFNKWLKLSINTFYSNSVSNNPSIGSNRVVGNEARQTQAALFYSPRIPLENPDGTLTINDRSNANNPAAWFYIKDRSLNKRLFFSPNLQVKFTSELSANVVLGIDNTTSGRELFSPAKARLPEQTTNNFGGFTNNENKNVSLESYLTYNKQLGKDHNLAVVGGVGYYKASGVNNGFLVFNVPTDATENYNLGLAPQSDLNQFYSGKFARTKLSQFARVNYSFKEKYFVGLTARNDGSTSFPPSKKWGFFPAVSAGWTISSEQFLSNSPIISNLKLRASYGAAGNESFLANNIYYVNQYSNVYGTNYYIGGQQNTGVIQTQLANPNLTWETDITANIGLDFGFFNGRITGSFDVFQRTAKDLLDFAQLPFNSSITSIAQNVGSTRSNGFDLSVTGLLVKTKAVNWSINANISRSFVYWIERNPNVALNPWVGAKDGVFDIYGWRSNGFFNSYDDVQNYKAKDGKILQPGSFAGNPKYVDQNGDGKLDGLDIVNLGNYNPSINFGLGTSVSYKGFDLNVQTYGFLKRNMFDGWSSMSSLFSMAIKQNQHVSVLDVWSSVNTTGTRSGIGFGSTENDNPVGTTDYLMQSVNFMRLKNVTVGYSVPTALLQKKNFAKNIRLFLDFQNLATFTNFSGLDPEMEFNASPFPIPRTTTVGLNITF